jgi:hypothetical protein
MSVGQGHYGFEVDLVNFECALTVDRCALLLITYFLHNLFPLWLTIAVTPALHL